MVAISEGQPVGNILTESWPSQIDHNIIKVDTLPFLAGKKFTSEITYDSYEQRASGHCFYALRN